MVGRYHCTVCGKPEAECKCVVRDYCIVCQGEDDVRLCEDGLYYCLSCREACDYHAEY